MKLHYHRPLYQSAFDLVSNRLGQSCDFDRLRRFCIALVRVLETMIVVTIFATIVRRQLPIIYCCVTYQLAF